MNRTEKKFLISKPQANIIYKQLLGQGFTEVYPARRVTSIYYDTLNLDLYHIAEEGVSSRQKIRVRFYNRDSDKAFLEYKLKKAEVGWKKALSIENMRGLKTLKSNQFPLMKVPRIVDKTYHPIVGVIYKRIYMLSNCGQERITLDSSLKVGRVINQGNIFSANINILSDINVMELKVETQHEGMQSKLSRIIENNNLIMSKFSKYCYSSILLY